MVLKIILSAILGAMISWLIKGWNIQTKTITSIRRVVEEDFQKERANSLSDLKELQKKKMAVEGWLRDRKAQAYSISQPYKAEMDKVREHTKKLVLVLDGIKSVERAINATLPKVKEISSAKRKKLLSAVAAETDHCKTIREELGKISRAILKGQRQLAGGDWGDSEMPPAIVTVEPTEGVGVSSSKIIGELKENNNGNLDGSSSVAARNGSAGRNNMDRDHVEKKPRKRLRKPLRSLRDSPTSGS